MGATRAPQRLWSAPFSGQNCFGAQRTAPYGRGDHHHFNTGAFWGAARGLLRSHSSPFYHENRLGVRRAAFYGRIAHRYFTTKTVSGCDGRPPEVANFFTILPPNLFWGTSAGPLRSQNSLQFYHQNNFAGKAHGILRSQELPLSLSPKQVWAQSTAPWGCRIHHIIPEAALGLAARPAMVAEPATA